MAECNHDCENCKSKCEHPDGATDFRVDAHPLSHVEHVIGIVSGKGGVGKSLVTALAALAMQKRGHSVGILDADVTGPSIPKIFGADGMASASSEGILPYQTKSGVDIMSVNLLMEDKASPVIWRGPAIASVVKQFWSDVIWTDQEYLFVDMPPGTGDVPLTVFQSLPLDGIIVVASPQDLVSLIVEKAVRMAREMNIHILGVIENMSYLECSKCGEKNYLFGHGNTKEVAEKYGVDFLGEIPIIPEIAALCDAGNIGYYNAEFMAKTCEALEKLAK